MNSELKSVVISRGICLNAFRPFCCLFRLLHYYAFGHLLWTFSLGIPARVGLVDYISQRELWHDVDRPKDVFNLVVPVAVEVPYRPPPGPEEKRAGSSPLLRVKQPTNLPFFSEW